MAKNRIKRTYPLSTRTIEMIEEMAEEYNEGLNDIVTKGVAVLFEQHKKYGRV